MTEPRAQGAGTPMMRFRGSRKDRPRLAADEAKRQGEITLLAFQLLGKDAAIAFLNTENAQLGARPLDVAIGTAEGFGRVETELSRCADDAKEGI